LRPFGLMWRGPTEPGQVLELRFGFSLRGVEQARRNLYADCGSGRAAFDSRRAKTATVWRQHLNKIKIETSSAARQPTGPSSSTSARCGTSTAPNFP
jgi:putative alpha-1,2-mannosidase